MHSSMSSCASPFSRRAFASVAFSGPSAAPSSPSPRTIRAFMATWHSGLCDGHAASLQRPLQ